MVRKRIVLLSQHFLMGNGKTTNNTRQFVSAIFLILTLLWVTVSLPFVTATQQELAKQNKTENCKSSLFNCEEEAADPLGNTTEEKAPGNTSISEEYLHECFEVNYLCSTPTRNYKYENAGTYIAFYGELLAPPPDE